MAANTGAEACSGTLTGTTADTVTLTASGESLMIVNRDSTQTLWFRFGSTAAVAAADENFPILPSQTLIFNEATFGGNRPYSVVGNGNAYTVALF